MAGSCRQPRAVLRQPVPPRLSGVGKQAPRLVGVGDPAGPAKRWALTGSVMTASTSQAYGAAAPPRIGNNAQPTGNLRTSVLAMLS